MTKYRHNYPTQRAVALRTVVLFSHRFDRTVTNSCRHTLHGTVADPTDALVPSALVTLSSGKRDEGSTSSGAEGAFAFDHLVPGRYT